MKLSGIAGASGIAIIMACAPATPVTSPVPANVPASSPTQPVLTPPPVTSPPAVPVKPTGSWNFAYAPGTYVYSFKTTATVAPASDTTSKQLVPELDQRATIIISATGDVKVIDPALITSARCDPNSALTARAQQLIPKIPERLTVGDRWRDSTTTTGCRGSIPAESTAISNYVVVGDTTFGNTSLLHVQRTDSLSANGEGADGQHRILITATGSGQADLFLDFTTGRLAGLQGVQNTLVNVSTSGRLVRFAQHVTESILIVGHP